MKRIREFFKNINWKKIIVILTIFTVSVYFLIATIFEIFPFSNISLADKTQMIGSVKNYFQILFFTTTAVIAILSYRRAKETLFNPIRTEIFKIQVKEYDGLVEFFRNNSFIEEFDYQKIVHINSIRMLDAYAETFFKDEIDMEKILESREDLYKDIAGGVISQKHMISDDFETIDYDTKVDKANTNKVDIINPALLLKKWDGYVHAMTDYTKQYEDKIDHIEKISSSPMLPSKLVELIKLFQRKKVENLTILSDMLTEKAKELPEKYPTAKSLNHLNLTGFWNDFNHRKNDLTDEANEILKFINSYLKIDSII